MNVGTPSLRVIASPDDLGTAVPDRPSTLIRVTVEAAFYLLMTLEVFHWQLGFGGTDLLLGGIVTVSGIFVFSVYLCQGEKLPRAFFFVIALNIAASFSQVLGHGDKLFLGSGLPELVHLTSHTLLFSYLVMNSSANKRVILFLALVILLAVYLGGQEFTSHGDHRLNLVGIGGGFSNPNDLAYTVAIFAVSLFFLSLRNCSFWFQLVLWVAAISLIVVCSLTVSRGGMLALGVGSLLFIIVILFYGKVVRNLIIFTATTAFVVWLFPDQLAQSFQALMARASDSGDDVRLYVYSADLWRELRETFVIGRGVDNAYTSVGIQAHNTFLYTHMAYGGTAALVYMFWIIMLAKDVYNVIVEKNAAIVIKFHVTALFLMIIVCHAFSNRGYLFISSIFAIAIIEKYTSIYRKPFLWGIFR